ncbi:hypothetical protein QQF64_005132 [Cirrhinus molitorella]|uniref:NIDO domain-containing protein n=1 Tax=Cirrhinus molitorella TaxID=172907 RepID=A0ABR3MKH7_9TELE
MRLSLLVFISVLSVNPCHSYTVLDNPWRSPDNRYPSQYKCDADVSWAGWYRFFIHVEDGVVTRGVCGSHVYGCCLFPSKPIKVKACPGGYYVYEFLKPVSCLSYCAGQQILYSFGSNVADTNNPTADDGSSSVIQLLSPFHLFGRTYQQIYVNNNGHLTFNQSSSAYTPYSFPANRNQDIIAGLWTNLDNSARGFVSYNQYTSGNVLTRATQDINTHFPNLTFSASWVFVATWNKVAYYSLTNTETSFQVVLISGSNYSFILMNYGDIAITGHPVEAGYDTINSTHYFVIPGSVNGSSISNLRNSSNVNVPDNVVGFQVRLSSFSDLTQSGNIEMVLQQIKQELVNQGTNNNNSICTFNNTCNNICTNDNICTDNRTCSSNNNSICINICTINNICTDNRTCSSSNNTNICTFNNPCNNSICNNNIFTGGNNNINICTDNRTCNNNNICTINNACNNICTDNTCNNNNHICTDNNINSTCNNNIFTGNNICTDIYNYSICNNDTGRCDNPLTWVGWYRLFINGQSAQMPDTCVNYLSCGTVVSLWLNGAHPTVEDGVVTRGVCGSWVNGCCYFQSTSIRVKACPGGYYVYEFVRPNGCDFAYCAAPKIFYPFGSAAGDIRNPAVKDGSSSVIQLLSPFLFFGRTYKQIYVNNNGHLTFNQSSSAYTPYSFPTNGSQDIIAGLWTDLDNRVRGVVSYQQYTSGNVLTNVTRDINTYFTNLNFSASWVFVATWNKVAYFSVTNTAGYDTINSTNYFVIPGSKSGSFISNLRNSSNVNVPGRWAFRVDGGPINSILKNPCYKYTVLDDPWRSTDNLYPYTSPTIMCDSNVIWVGWYRLFLNGQSAQMPDTCVNQISCGTHVTLWLNGAHPTVQDGVVTRAVCGRTTGGCCTSTNSPIRVKACPGGYYVYEFLKPNGCNVAYCAALKIFYPFGSAAGDTSNPAVEDGSSSVIQLLSPFLFFGRTYRQIYVNNNGHLTFNQPSSAYTPYSFPTNGSQDIIAGLWTDLDNRVKGVVSYQQYTSGNVLTNVTRDINTYFTNLNFIASWVFVATWNKVAYFSVTNTIKQELVKYGLPNSIALKLRKLLKI